MPERLILALAVCAALFASPALAAKPAAPAPAPAPAPAAVSNARIAWGGIGYYNLSQSVNTAFGSFSSSTGAFGLNVGGAINVVQLGTDVPLAIWGNAGLGVPSGGTFWPLTAGAAARFDKLPVQLLGGLGLTIMPVSGGGPTGVGLAIQAMGFYPLPQLNPNLSVQAQIGVHILSNSYTLFTLTTGAGWSF
jgi:opacity protein-like surface antigen